MNRFDPNDLIRIVKMIYNVEPKLLKRNKGIITLHKVACVFVEEDYINNIIIRGNRL